MADGKTNTGEITGLLRVAGDDTTMADQLWQLVYPELNVRFDQRGILFLPSRPHVGRLEG